MAQGFNGWNNYDGSGFNPRGQGRGGMQGGMGEGAPPWQNGILPPSPGFNPRGQRMPNQQMPQQAPPWQNGILPPSEHRLGGGQQMPQQAQPWTRGIFPPSEHRLGGGQNLGPHPFDPSQGPDPFQQGPFNPRGQGRGGMQGGMGEGGPFGGNAIQSLRPSANPNFNPRGMRTPGGQQGGPFGGNALSMLRPGSSAGSMAQGGPFSGAKNIANLMPGGGSGGGFMSKLGGLGKKIGGMSTMGKVGLGMGGLGAAKLAGGYMNKRKAQKAGARQRDQQAQAQQMRGPMF